MRQSRIPTDSWELSLSWTGRRPRDKLMRWSAVAMCLVLVLYLVLMASQPAHGARTPPRSLRRQWQGDLADRPHVVFGLVSAPSPRLQRLLDATVGSCEGVLRIPPFTSLVASDWTQAIQDTLRRRNADDSHYVYLALPHQLMDPDFMPVFSDLLHQLADTGMRVDLVVLREYLGTSLQQHQPPASAGGSSISEAMQAARGIHSALDTLGAVSGGYPHGVLRAHDQRAEGLVGAGAKAVRRWLLQDLGLQWEGVAKDLSPAYREVPEALEGERQAISDLLRWISERSLGALPGLPPLPHLVRWRSPQQERKQPTRIVIITQVRNVVHTLQSFLDSVLWAADRILLLDTGSTDGTIVFVQRLAVTEERYRGKLAIRRCSHGVMGWNEGKAYRELLDWAREEERATHIMCPDSDEYPTWNWRRHQLLRHAVLSLPPKTALTVRLFHVYNGTDRWISPSPRRWQQAEKAPLAWHDDGHSHRGRNMHHISRVPNGFRSIGLMRTPGSLGSVHFKFASLAAIGAKTLWYRHLEYDSGSKSRALGSFYTNKLPHIGAGNLAPVPLEEWYGPESQRHWTRRWTEPASYAWRVRMVLDWRAAWKKRGKQPPRALALPDDWPFGVRLGADPEQSADPHVHEHEHTHHHEHHSRDDDADALDRKCRERRARGQGKVAELLPVREGPLRFLWAVAPDRTIPRWLQNHERHVRQFAARALSAGACLRGGNGTEEGARGLVLDVGANSGYYGLMALAAGCRTLFVDPQPYCGMLLDASVAANGWTNRGRVLRAAAGDQVQDEAMDVWCDTPCYGRVGAPGVGAPKQSPRQARDGTRPMVRLANHEWLQDPDLEVTLLKIDVEGAEASVLRGLWELFERRAVRAATVEVTPMFYRQRRRGPEMRQEIWREMQRIHEVGYEFWAPRMNGEPQSYGDYKRLEDSNALRKYLLDAPFKQHDVFLYRK